MHTEHTMHTHTQTLNYDSYFRLDTYRTAETILTQSNHAHRIYTHISMAQHELINSDTRRLIINCNLHFCRSKVSQAPLIGISVIGSMQQLLLQQHRAAKEGGKEGNKFLSTLCLFPKLHTYTFAHWFVCNFLFRLIPFTHSHALKWLGSVQFFHFIGALYFNA